MSIFFLLLLLGIVSFKIPQKYMKNYFIVAGIIISAVFFFYTPPETDDLYRYYALFDILNDMSLTDIINSQFNTNDWLYDYMLNDYRNNTQTFMVVLVMLSKIGIKQLLPFVFSLMTYLPLFFIIEDFGKKEKLSKKNVCIVFCAILFCIDLRFVSCLRNLSAYSLLIYVLYQDLVKNKNKVFCFIGYFLLCKLHMACVPVIVIRVLIEITKKIWRYIIVLMLLCTQMLCIVGVKLADLFFSADGFLYRLVQKIEEYFLGRTAYNFNGALYFGATIIAVLFIWLIAVLYKGLSKRYYKYGSCLLYTVALTFGCIGQYDILVRQSQLVIMMSLPFVLILLKNEEVSELWDRKCGMCNVEKSMTKKMYNLICNIKESLLTLIKLSLIVLKSIVFSIVRVVKTALCLIKNIRKLSFSRITEMRKRLIKSITENMQKQVMPHFIMVLDDKNKMTVIIYEIIFALMGASLIFYTLFSYIPLAQGLF